MNKIFGFMLLGVLMIGFQNCSKVAFQSVDTGLTKSGFAAGPEITDIVKDDAIVFDTETVVVVEEEVKKDEVVVVDEEKKNDEVAVVDVKEDDDKDNDSKDEEKKHDEVAVTDDGKDDSKKDEEDKDDHVAVVENEKKDDKDDKDEDKNDDEQKDREVAEVKEDKDEDDCDNDGEDKDGDKKNTEVAKNDDDKDDSKKEDDKKHDDTLTAEQVDLFACASDDGDNSKKVLICHNPPGNYANRHTICISRSALKAHMSHGKDAAPDTIGACGDDAVAGN